MPFRSNRARIGVVVKEAKVQTPKHAHRVIGRQHQPDRHAQRLRPALWHAERRLPPVKLPDKPSHLPATRQEVAGACDVRLPVKPAPPPQVRGGQSAARVSPTRPAGAFGLVPIGQQQPSGYVQVAGDHRRACSFALLQRGYRSWRQKAHGRNARLVRPPTGPLASRSSSCTPSTPTKSPRDRHHRYKISLGYTTFG
jgi:hypothetical protein